LDRREACDLAPRQAHRPRHAAGLHRARTDGQGRTRARRRGARAQGGRPGGGRRPVTRRRWIALALAVAIVLAVLAAGAGWWYHEHTLNKEVVGSSTVEFVPREKPQAKPRPKKLVDEVPWPTFGYDHQRPPLSPSSHRPPYRRLWMLRARWFVEFPPAVGYGNVYVSQLRGVFYAVDAKTGKLRWKRDFAYCSAASPSLTRRLVIETFIPEPCTRGP